MSYFKSLRFKFMLLSLLPQLVVATVFISHSVIIAHQVETMMAASYMEALTNAGAGDGVINAAREVSISMGFIAPQWIAVFFVTAICNFIPCSIAVRKIIKPIRKVTEHSDSLAEGNVQIEIIKNRTDEIGMLQGSFQKLVSAVKQQAELIQRMADGDISGSYTPRSPSDIVGNSLVQMLERNNAAMTQILLSTKQLAMAAAQIADGSQALAGGATEQAASVEQLSSTINEVDAQTKSNADMADKAAALAEEIKGNANKGSECMERMIQAVKEINDASQSIGKVIKVIDDIAFQTNILALNAAVEAARAGQHGKGFSVVAEEVRNLAAKSAEAAKETDALIENSISKTELGVRIAGETASSLEKIVSGINESSMIVGEIARSSKQQSSSITQITDNINQVAQVVQQNSATSEESAASSEEMSSQAAILQNLVLQFKLKDMPNNSDYDAASAFSDYDPFRYGESNAPYGFLR